MSKFYAVHGGPSIYAIVQAESKEVAFDIFAKGQMDDEIMREEIDNFIINSSLLEKFYRDQNGSFFDDMTGEYPPHILKMKEDERDDYIQSCVEKNVRAFWKATPHFAEEYLSEMKRNSEMDFNEFEANFSEEFYIETIKLIIQGGKWYDDFKIIEIDPSKDYQLIFRD